MTSEQKKLIKDRYEQAWKEFDKAVESMITNAASDLPDMDARRKARLHGKANELYGKMEGMRYTARLLGYNIITDRKTKTVRVVKYT